MKCLICYQPLLKNENDYHSGCLKKTFGFKKMPEFDIDESQLEAHAKKILNLQESVTGVQPKLSLGLKDGQETKRFTIIDEQSSYIIKPQSQDFTALPENEDLCMHLAKESGLRVATHSLVRLNSGHLAYLTKRFDREGTNKIACEDLCQLSESLTMHKYRGSYEKVGKIIKKYSTQFGLDLLEYYRLVLFSFVIGNTDMHLKNFSMLEENGGNDFVLSPAYDLVCTQLIMKDNEQVALNLNGKKNRLSKQDFDLLGANLHLSAAQIESSYKNLIKKENNFFIMIDRSFLPQEQKASFKTLLAERLNLFR